MKRIILILFIVAIVSSFVCAEGIDENTALMLHMDDAGLTDSSDNSHSVTLNGDAALNTGTYKFTPGSAYFDGNGDYITVSSSDSLYVSSNDIFTVDFWYYKTASSISLLSFGNDLPGYGTGFYVFASGVHFYTDVGGYSGGLTIPPESSLNTWYHIAYVRDSTDDRFFVDGILQKTQAKKLFSYNEDAQWKIGKFSSGWPYWYNGYIDELRISKGIARWTENFTPPSEPYSAPPPTPFATCGDNLVVNHIVGDVAPVTTTITYGTVMTDLSGESKCWITQNLGASQQATSATDATDASAGWYWQFNRKQGYKHDGTTRTPDSIWITSIDEDSSWVSANDPCTIELGAGWRLPTSTELRNADANGGWVNVYDSFDSVLKIHAAGVITDTASLSSRGNAGWSGSSYQASNTKGVSLVAHVTIYCDVFSNQPKVRAQSLRCIYDEPPSPPTSSNFTSDETTNFSEVTDITNVTNLTLATTGKGKIKFPESTEINAEAQDYDTNIVIEDEFISVNTAALDESFNTSATITLEGVTCPVETITYQEGTFTSKDDIISGGKNCELEGVCSNIQCSGTTLTFDVAHFTGFAAGSNANLTTEAQAGVFYPLDPIEFTAEYINSTDGTPISGECNITFDDDWDTEYTMDFDSTDYNYTKSFAISGLHEYNVTCSSANFVTLEANDTKLVSSVDIPEFSVLTLGLGLIAVLVGLFVIRRKK